jgi:hypothetical protein
VHYDSLNIPCSPELEEKARLEDVKMKESTRMEREVVEDLKAVRQDLEELQVKCRQIHLVADAEVVRTDEKRSETEESLETAK